MRRAFLLAIALSATVYARTATVQVSRGADPSDSQLSRGADPDVVHLLNRIGFGPRPGDVERVRAIGLKKYIEQQLHPERIADVAIDERLNDLTTIALSSREIQEMYERPARE